MKKSHENSRVVYAIAWKFLLHKTVMQHVQTGALSSESVLLHRGGVAPTEQTGGILSAWITDRPSSYSPTCTCMHRHKQIWTRSIIIINDDDGTYVVVEAFIADFLCETYLVCYENDNQELRAPAIMRVSHGHFLVFHLQCCGCMQASRPALPARQDGSAGWMLPGALCLSQNRIFISVKKILQSNRSQQPSSSVV
jgi:hypothetical protein